MMLHVPFRRHAVLFQSTARYVRSTTYVRSGKERNLNSACRRASSCAPQLMPTTSTWTNALFRSFSTSSKESTPSHNENDVVISKKKEPPIVWLYQRTPGNMTKPRLILGLASFHSVYWTWYTQDFMVAVNQSPLEHLHIDPVVGYVGMFFALFVNIGAALYPGSLISGIGIKEKELCVFTHSLPTMAPSKKGVVYEIGNVCMDPSTEETKKIVDTLGGDIGSYRGFVALKAERRRLPYLLQIEDPNEVVDSWMLLQILVNPELAKKEIERGGTSGGGIEKPKRSGKKQKARNSRGNRKRGRR